MSYVVYMLTAPLGAWATCGSIYKYSLGLTEENQKIPHLVVAALKNFMALVSEFLANDRNFSAPFKTKASLSLRGCMGAQCEYEHFADEPTPTNCHWWRPQEAIKNRWTTQASRKLERKLCTQTSHVMQGIGLPIIHRLLGLDQCQNIVFRPTADPTFCNFFSREGSLSLRKDVGSTAVMRGPVFLQFANCIK